MEGAPAPAVLEDFRKRSARAERDHEIQNHLMAVVFESHGTDGGINHEHRIKSSRTSVS